MKTDGRLGIARVTVRPKENRLWVDYAVRDDQKGRDEMGSALLVFGLKSAPVVELNDKIIAVRPQTVGGETAYVIPLGDGKPGGGTTGQSIADRYLRAQAARGARVAAGVK